MTNTRWQKMQELFNGALKLSDHNRYEFLNDSCNGDTELFRELEELLKIDSEDDSIFNYSGWFIELILNAEINSNLMLAQKKIKTC